MQNENTEADSNSNVINIWPMVLAVGWINEIQFFPMKNKSNSCLNLYL